MRHSIKLSAIALVAAMLVGGPAQAATLNLGGNNGGDLLNLGGTDGTDAAATVNGGDVLNLGGTGGNTNAAVNAHLGGSDPTTADVNLNTGGTGGSNPTNAIVNLNTGGDDSVLGTDLFGAGTDPTTADVNLGNTGTAGVDLFGDDGDSNANVTLGNGTDGIVDDLFGSGDGTTVPGVDVGSVGDILNTTAGDTLGDLFGPSGPGAIDGGGDGNGVPGAGGPDLFGPAGGAGNGGTGNAGGVQVASLGDDGACLDPSSSQLSNLINRHAYTDATMSSWRGTTQLKIVKIDLCDAAKSRLDASHNIAALQDYLAANPAFAARLKSKGYSPDDVIAVDRNGKTLIVYVT